MPKRTAMHCGSTAILNIFVPSDRAGTASDAGGGFYRLGKSMQNKSRQLPSADEIAEMATRGEDVSKFFTNKFTVVRPIRRVNVDLTLGMLRELDERAVRLNVSRQAVIKTLLRQAMDQNGPAGRARKRQAG